MDKFLNAIAWIGNNWEMLCGLIAFFFGLATAIVKMTKTPEDDKFVSKVYKFWESIVDSVGALIKRFLPGIKKEK